MTHLLPFLWSVAKALLVCFGVAAFFVLTGIYITKHSRTGRANLKSIVSNE